ncbi:M48 family metalloprotease [Thiobacter aerophilum]|uniref:M48 family metalloprotease n=1 Tax=Thiobacter aerophilum TaxID=3121275 RepID=A0ABV0EFT6_9BURK
MTFRFRWLVALLAALPFATPLLAADNLPDLGEASQSVFSAQTERKVGEAIMRELRLDRAYYDDPEITDYLNALGWRLAAHSGASGQDFEFFLMRDDTLNAFALPGGYIGVHTGLLLAAQNESELAGVLAHEIAHVTQRHIARMVAAESRNTLTTLAALAVAILAARSNSQVASAAVATAQAGAIQSQLDFTRENEREADRVGLQTLQAAGFDPRGMVSFFERLQKYNRIYENNAPSYLRTHPLTTERIADMEARVAELPYRQVPDSLEFQFARAKLRAVTGNPREAVTYFRESLREHKYANETATRYGLAMALLRDRQVDAAWEALTRLRARLAAPHPWVETLAGEILTAQGRSQALLDHYRQALERFPFHRALIYGYADALLKAGQAQDALKLVENRLRSTPADARLYELQARGYAQLGQVLAQHRALAEAQVLRGNLPAAIEQLQIALRSGQGDFYQLSSVEARLKELRSLDAETRKR